MTQPVRQLAPALVKSDLWWTDKGAPILGLIYLLLALDPARPGLLLTLPALLLFLTAFAGIAGFGYVVNDLFDLRADALAGKRNTMAGRSPWARAGLVLGLGLLGFLPWALWPGPPQHALGMLLLQTALLIAYAAPPLRLKERHVAGPVCDALYAFTVPLLITLAAWLPLGGPPQALLLPLLATLLVGALANGLRGILLHQIRDADNDRRAGLRTFATTVGVEAVWRVLARVVLPLDALACALSLLLMAWALPVFALIVLLTFALRAFKWVYLRDEPLDLRALLLSPRTPEQQVDFWGRQVLNDLRTVVFPVALLFALVGHSPAHLPLLILHQVLFRPLDFAALRRDLRWTPTGLSKLFGRHR
ncbi:UbiA family prenyltransferase [Piscinibacter sp. Jin2]|uniref:UbiA family prenyltransferase n=1 Tax=Aquariibacter lacus TaxID=2801332 RepID=A0A9X0XBF8_9BURK|nr:UbiA family prenyltransferase [Piscinibacter lacus]MBL0718660.1 UbiA family prenyltransferase [Piscinibacter lacus]